MFTLLIVVAVCAMLLCSAVLLSALALAGRSNAAIPEEPLVRDHPDDGEKMASLQTVH